MSIGKLTVFVWCVGFLMAALVVMISASSLPRSQADHSSSPAATVNRPFAPAAPNAKDVYCQLRNCETLDEADI